MGVDFEIGDRGTCCTLVLGVEGNFLRHFYSSLICKIFLTRHRCMLTYLNSFSREAQGNIHLGIFLQQHRGFECRHVVGGPAKTCSNY